MLTEILANRSSFQRDSSMLGKGDESFIIDDETVWELSLFFTRKVDAAYGEWDSVIRPTCKNSCIRLHFGSFLSVYEYGLHAGGVCVTVLITCCIGLLAMLCFLMSKIWW